MRYWGHWPADGGDIPTWPENSGPKVFVYLKPSSARDGLLRALAMLGYPTLAVLNDRAGMTDSHCPVPSVHVSSRPVDIELAARECDLAITNAGHGILASMILAGKPQMMFPVFVEQGMNAHAVERLGAGCCVSPHEYSRIPGILENLLATNAYREAAQRVAARYVNQMPGKQLPELVDYLERVTVTQ
jgi:UDP:flavonoid glycosyltransferase YjiC (YdhE family)